MSELKPVYLVHGDDEAKVAAWRTRLRRRAEAEQGEGALDLYEAPGDQPEAVAAALAALTIMPGTRYLVADRVEQWRSGPGLEPLLEALSEPPPDTVLLLLARGKPNEKLIEAVRSAGGEVRSHELPKRGQLPAWIGARAAELGLTLDRRAATALAAVTAGRPARVQRELEKLAIMHPAGASVTAEQVAELAGGAAARAVFALSDSVAAGDTARALTLIEQLGEQGEHPGRLVFALLRRALDVQRAAELLEAGAGERDVAGALGGSPWAAKHRVAEARRAGRAALDRLVAQLAQLEVEQRGGGEQESPAAALTLALVRAA